jgi:hypothetical protein
VGLANLGSESETCVGSRVRLVGIFISFKKNFYRLPFTPPSLVRRIGPSEDQLLKSRKHAAAKQSKLDAAFAKYHNDVQDMHAKSDDLVLRNKTLRNKNKGMSHGLLGSCLEVER